MTGRRFWGAACDFYVYLLPKSRLKIGRNSLGTLHTVIFTV